MLKEKDQNKSQIKTNKTLKRQLKFEEHEISQQNRCELKCSVSLNSSCSLIGTRSVTLAKNSVISHERQNCICGVIYFKFN